MLARRPSISIGTDIHLASWADVADLINAEVTVIVGHAVRKSDGAGRFAEEWPVGEGAKDARIELAGQDLAARSGVVKVGHPDRPQIGPDLFAVKKPGENRGIGQLRKFACPRDQIGAVIQA